MARIQDLIAKNKAMCAKRMPWMSYWQQLSDVLMPSQANFTTPGMPGEQRGAAIYDGTPRLALRDLATTLDGLIKPKSSSWFDVEIDNDDLMEQEEAKLWLEEVKDRMWNAIYRKDARFIQRSGEVDLNLACFGWGVLWIQENRRRNGLLFKSFHLSQVAIEENEEGIVDSLSIQENFNARQADFMYRKYGKEPSRKVAEALQNSKHKSDQMFKFVQIVMPQEDFDARTIGMKGMPFVSELFDETSEEIIASFGFHEFPAAIPRWETVPGELYARSPGMIALPDSQTLQAMGKTLLVGGQRAVDPPIWVANDSIMSPLRTFPGGVTVLDLNGESTPIGAFPVTTNLPIGREMQNDYRRQVEAAFFKNIFNLPIETRQMTATEIIARKEEFIRVIGPVFGRLESDYIGHIVERVFGIMERAGALPPRPEVMLKERITFRFKSPIQQARKQMEIAALAETLNFLAPLSTAQPEILDNYDGDEIARDAPEWGGLPPKWLKPIKDRDALRAARSGQQEAMTNIAAAEPIAGAIKDIASAESLVK